MCSSPPAWLVATYILVPIVPICLGFIQVWKKVKQLATRAEQKVKTSSFLIIGVICELTWVIWGISMAFIYCGFWIHQVVMIPSGACLVFGLYVTLKRQQEKKSVASQTLLRPLRVKLVGVWVGAGSFILGFSLLFSGFIVLLIITIVILIPALMVAYNFWRGNSNAFKLARLFCAFYCAISLCMVCYYGYYYIAMYYRPGLYLASIALGLSIITLYLLMKDKSIKNFFPPRKTSESAREISLDKSQDTRNWGDLGKIYVKQGKIGAAINAFEQDVVAMPSNLKAWHNLAMVYEEARERGKALHCWAQAALLGDTSAGKRAAQLRAKGVTPEVPLGLNSVETKSSLQP